jgi:chemotaxis methyl-accepting protein methylase
VADILRYVPDQKYDVILFRESIYYIWKPRIRQVLTRYTDYLTPEGVLVVDMGKTATRKWPGILKLIERNFKVIVSNVGTQADPLIIVFRGNESP